MNNDQSNLYEALCAISRRPGPFETYTAQIQILGLTGIVACSSLACTDEGRDCREIELGTSINDYPVYEDPVVYGGTGLSGPSKQLKCCNGDPLDPAECEKTDSACECPYLLEEVDCTLPEHGPATIRALDQSEWGKSCDAPGGQWICFVWVQDGNVVATEQWCWD